MLVAQTIDNVTENSVERHTLSKTVDSINLQPPGVNVSFLDLFRRLVALSELYGTRRSVTEMLTPKRHRW